MIMGLIGKQIEIKIKGELYIATVLEKYIETHAWSTGQSDAFGACTHYIVRIEDDIRHIYARDILQIID